MVKIYDLNSVSLNESIEKTEDVGKSQDTGSVQDESSKSQTSETTTVEVDDSASDASTEEDEGSDNQVEISEQPAVTTDVIHVTDSTHTTVMKGCTIVNNYPPPPCVDEFNEKHVVPIIKGTIEQATKKKNTITTAIACGVALTLILVIVLTVVLLTKIKPPEVLSCGLRLSLEPRFIKRPKWGAKDATRKIRFLQKQLTSVIIDTTGNLTCEDHTVCMNAVKRLQHEDMKAGFDDISSNFILAEDGYVYKGRGWGKVGQRVPGFDNTSLEILLIGNFDYELPRCANVSLFLLLEEGCKEGRLSPDFRIYGKNQFVTTDTMKPNSALVKDMINWGRWSPRRAEGVIGPPADGVDEITVIPNEVEGSEFEEEGKER